MMRRLLVPVRRDRSIGACLVLTLVGVWPAGAAAYSSPSLYAADPVRFGGGGGRAFTGARAFVLPLTSEAQAEAGCAVAPGGSAAGGWLWLLLLLRRRWLGLMLLGTLGLRSGCARVQPHERGRLAKPDMQLAPDPDLAAGSEHALEYREGAVGGLGGGGGGCGCN